MASSSIGIGKTSNIFFAASIVISSLEELPPPPPEPPSDVKHGIDFVLVASYICIVMHAKSFWLGDVRIYSHRLSGSNLKCHDPDLVELLAQGSS